MIQGPAEILGYFRTFFLLLGHFCTSLHEILPPISDFIQFSSAFSDLLDLSDHPLLLDIFSLGPPQLRAGLGFYFFQSVIFGKHPKLLIPLILLNTSQDTMGGLPLQTYLYQLYKLLRWRTNTLTLS